MQILYVPAGAHTHTYSNQLMKDTFNEILEHARRGMTANTILEINLILKKYFKEILEHIIIRKESFSLTAASSCCQSSSVYCTHKRVEKCTNKYLGAPKCEQTGFITGTEPFCTRNSPSFYPHERTVTPRYPPLSITDSEIPLPFILTSVP